MKKRRHRPHKKLLALLKGPKVPDKFRLFGGSDGCTGVPDGWWYEPCLTHDYEYHLCRQMPQKTKKQRKKWKLARKIADIHLKQNIRILSDWKVSTVTGRVEQHPLRIRSWAGFLVSRTFYRGVRWMGRRFAS